MGSEPQAEERSSVVGDRVAGDSAAVGDDGARAGSEAPGIALRHMALTLPAAERRARPSRERPHCHGVLLEWNVDESGTSASSTNAVTASIWAGWDDAAGERSTTADAAGSFTASLYTNAAFGIVGGELHPDVRAAAGASVDLAQSLWERGEPVVDFDYPRGSTVNAYLVGYAEVRRLQGDFDELCEGGEGHPLLPLFDGMQQVLYLLRTAVE
ncbi:MAG: hypothetical protein ACYTFV_01695 [Planctomycetota bacterium]|jgi:hypothetical protein